MSIYSSPELLASWFQRRLKFFNSFIGVNELGCSQFRSEGHGWQGLQSTINYLPNLSLWNVKTPEVWLIWNPWTKF